MAMADKWPEKCFQPRGPLPETGERNHVLFQSLDPINTDPYLQDLSHTTRNDKKEAFLRPTLVGKS